MRQQYFAVSGDDANTLDAHAESRPTYAIIEHALLSDALPEAISDAISDAHFA